MDTWFPELEQFFGVGEGKLFWRFTLKNVGGFLVGGFLGHRVATVLGQEGLPVMLLSAAAAAIGIWLTTQQRGMMRLLRLWLLVRFLAASYLGERKLASSDIYTTADESTKPRMRVRARRGGVLLRIRPDTTLRPQEVLNGKHDEEHP